MVSLAVHSPSLTPETEDLSPTMPTVGAICSDLSSPSNGCQEINTTDSSALNDVVSGSHSVETESKSIIMPPSLTAEESREPFDASPSHDEAPTMSLASGESRESSTTDTSQSSSVKQGSLVGGFKRVLRTRSLPSYLGGVGVYSKSRNAEKMLGTKTLLPTVGEWTLEPESPIPSFVESPLPSIGESMQENGDENVESSSEVIQEAEDTDGILGEMPPAPPSQPAEVTTEEKSAQPQQVPEEASIGDKEATESREITESSRSSEAGTDEPKNAIAGLWKSLSKTMSAPFIKQAIKTKEVEEAKEEKIEDKDEVGSTVPSPSPQPSGTQEDEKSVQQTLEAAATKESAKDKEVTETTTESDKVNDGNDMLATVLNATNELAKSVLYSLATFEDADPQKEDAEATERSAPKDKAPEDKETEEGIISGVVNSSVAGANMVVDGFLTNVLGSMTRFETVSEGETTPEEKELTVETPTTTDKEDAKEGDEEEEASEEGEDEDSSDGDESESESGRKGKKWKKRLSGLLKRQKSEKN